VTVAGPAAPSAEPDYRILAAIEALGQRLAGVRAQIDRVIFGQDAVVDQTLITLLSGGHALLIGVPGLAKTRPVLPTLRSNATARPPQPGFAEVADAP